MKRTLELYPEGASTLRRASTLVPKKGNVPVCASGVMSHWNVPDSASRVWLVFQAAPVEGAVCLSCLCQQSRRDAHAWVMLDGQLRPVWAAFGRWLRGAFPGKEKLYVECYYEC